MNPTAWMLGAIPLQVGFMDVDIYDPQGLARRIPTAYFFFLQENIAAAILGGTSFFSLLPLAVCLLVCLSKD